MSKAWCLTIGAVELNTVEACSSKAAIAFMINKKPPTRVHEQRHCSSGDWLCKHQAS